MVTWHGLSPPARGSLFRRDIGYRYIGSIPARAGEPLRSVVTLNLSKVYPRPRGGAGHQSRRGGGWCGLSPPARGSHILRALAEGARRSIPARAGEPRHQYAILSLSEVYPRPRGGAVHTLLSRLYHEGLSPPARGSHRTRQRCSALARSIPARAGEPVGERMRRLPLKVYPRPRGGAPQRPTTTGAVQGLSPPARGSRCLLRFSVQGRGSIPARAGEPACLARSSAQCEVYPRPRGGAATATGQNLRVQGLSPPARGSHRPDVGEQCRIRSIPARAGEPLVAVACAMLREVYPRPRGGAIRHGLKTDGYCGLSPPARGSPKAIVARRNPSRSIPARAGEPFWGACLASGYRGLSPPARGSR